MALITTAPRGTQDLLPENSFKNQWLESTLAKTAADFGFSEIRFPTFEHTELFNRSVGDTTDIVQKEMYTFEDKGGRSITLRPEGTASAVRLLLENGLDKGLLPVKAYYLIPCFCSEKPQAGRLSEFHQFGVEFFGAATPKADCEIITLADECIRRLGVKGVSLFINSIGCPECRAEYRKALVEYFKKREDKLCKLCRERLNVNPLRVLDCKDPDCDGDVENAPKITDYLCGDCREHFEQVKTLLTESGVDFTVNPRIVRGLDYYNGIVFEFISSDIGAQGTVCGGGRYDGLAAQMGGSPICGLGFGMGLERMLLLLEKQGLFPEAAEGCRVFIGSMGEKAEKEAFRIALALRREGVAAEYDSVGRSVKAQMKYADKIRAGYTVVLGDSELESGVCRVKRMSDGETREIKISDLVGFFR
jgi:histidyl-tRNA synthetase